MVAQWRHNEHDGASNYRCPDGLFNRLFRGRSKKTSRLRVTGLCKGNTPVTGEFPSQRASNAEKVFIWWRHHANKCAVWFRRISQQIHINSEYRYWKLKCICFEKYRGYLKKNYGLDKCSDQLNLPTRTNENHAKKLTWTVQQKCDWFPFIFTYVT